MSAAAAITGVGMTPFGKHIETSLKDLAATAIEAAIAESGVDPEEIDMAFVGNAMASVVTGQVSVVGQTVLRDMGFSRFPVFNVDNACASSSSALALASQAIRAGDAKTVLVAGVEKLYAPERGRAFIALNGAADVEFVERAGIDVEKESIFVAAIYPERFARYSEAYGLEAEDLAKISVKNRANAADNPVAQYRNPMTVEEVLESRPIVPPLTALMCAPIGDGASAAIVRAADLAETGSKAPVWLRATSIGMGASPGGESAIAWAAERAYAKAGVAADDVDLAEVHDSISFNEMLAYEELGFCKQGEGARLIREGATAIDGSIPVNTSGGLESRGHPVAATGLAQIVELTTQLRGEAGSRQVAGARVGVAENAGGFAVDDTAAISVTIVGSDPA
jgi:acetyl-CoA acetyltransferase